MKRFITWTFLSAATSMALVCTGQEQQANKIIKEYFSLIDAGKIEEVGSLLADDLMVTAPFSPTPFNKTSWKQVGYGFVNAFPDMQHELLEWFAKDNQVATRGVFRGTQKGPLMGFPATHNKVASAFNTLFVLDGKGKIKTIHVLFDQKAYEAQLMKNIDPSAGMKDKIVQMLHAADEGNLEKFLSYWAPDGVNVFSGKQTSMEEMKGRVLAFKAGFPDIKRTVLTSSATENKVFVTGLMTGTNTGNFMQKSPTQRKIELSYMGEYHFNDQGKITYGRVEADFGSLSEQLYDPKN